MPLLMHIFTSCGNNIQGKGMVNYFEWVGLYVTESENTSCAFVITLQLQCRFIEWSYIDVLVDWVPAVGLVKWISTFAGKWVKAVESA